MQRDPLARSDRILSTAREEIKEQNHHSYDKKKVNQPASDVANKTEQPED
jgi:hypothetical protein